MRTPVRILKDAQRQTALDADGFILLPLFPRDVVEELLRLFARAVPAFKRDPNWPGPREPAPPPAAPGRVADVDDDGIREDALYDLCYATPELRREIHGLQREIATPWLNEHLEGYDIIGTTFMNKGPGVRSIVTLHQGWNWVDESEGQYAVQLWCPLVESDQTNGGLGVVAGSHKLEWLYRAAGDNSCFGNHYATLVKNYYRATAVHAGESILFNVRLVHGSGRNRVQSHRPAVIYAVVPKTAKTVHYLRIDESHLQAFTMSLTQSDVLIHGTPPEGETPLGVVEYHFTPPTAEQVKELLDRPIVGPFKGILPDEETVADLLSAAPREAVGADDERAPDAASPGQGPLAGPAREFVALYLGGAELPARLGGEWQLTGVYASRRREEVTINLERSGRHQVQVSIVPGGGSAPVFTTTRFLGIRHGRLPAEVDSHEFGDQLRELADRFREAEQTMTEVDSSRLWGRGRDTVTAPTASS
jgi:hypothetical protein